MARAWAIGPWTLLLVAAPYHLDESPMLETDGPSRLFTQTRTVRGYVFAETTHSSDQPKLRTSGRHPGLIGFNELLTLLAGTHIVHDFPDRGDDRVRVVIGDVVV